jgi:hypothetical protein
MLCVQRRIRALALLAAPREMVTGEKPAWTLLALM